MRVYAIADLHLDGGAGKPMDVFGTHWANHRERIFASWQEAVAPNDCVLIPGDICWAMYFADALSELEAISRLNGVKVLIRGNHDYWWNSLTRMRSRLPSNMLLIQNDSVDMGEFAVCGSRGWLLPTDSEFKQDDRKIYERELIRLELSLRSVKRRDIPIICMLHFPPLSQSGADTGFTELLERYGVSLCVYGHLHGKSCQTAFNGEHNGVEYRLCSADSLGFAPTLIDLCKSGGEDALPSAESPDPEDDRTDLHR